ncbi:MAG: CRISPR-associated endonuclease Cas1 [Schlesneria sp.]
MNIPYRNPRELPTKPLHERTAWGLSPDAWRADLFPVQIRLAINSPSVLHPFHHATICALLKGAHNGGDGGRENDETSYPDGVLFDVVEQARMSVEPGTSYHFGLLLIAAEVAEAHQTLKRLLTGIERIGTGRVFSTGLRGNFRVEQVLSLVSDRENATSSLRPIPRAELVHDIAAVKDMREITLNFPTPLHCERPRDLRTESHQCLDDQLFLPSVFLRRAARRLHDLGFLRAVPDIEPRHVELIRNELVWIETKYGPPQSRKPLSGAMGRVTLKLNEESLAEILVLAQYLRVGEKTRFGFGAFRIEDLGPSRYQATRSVSLLELALNRHDLALAAEERDVESGRLTVLAEDVLAKTYQPKPPKRVLLPAAVEGRDPRCLSVPHPEDQAIQDCVRRQLAPALDLLFEESSFAYRKGLGRANAATSLKRAYQEGFRWAVRSDFHRFFDSVDHRVLKRRLEVYVADSSLTDVIMSWVDSGAIQPGRGLPTGSSLSPLLANVFLDRFDEQVAHEGARLIRYADDFLVLFRNPADAERLFESVEDAAHQLKLHLNQQKTNFVDLDQPFEFLGYRFFKKEQWQVINGAPPRLIEELGWEETSASQNVDTTLIPLPGESDQSASTAAPLMIAGPDVIGLKVESKTLVVEYGNNHPETRLPRQRIGDLVLLGAPNIPADFFRMQRQPLPNLWIADNSGRLRGEVALDEPTEIAELIFAQVAAANSSERSLNIARPLVVSKLLNYATLADATPTRSSKKSDAGQIRELARKASLATDIEQLRGFEGAGAAVWYQSLQARLHIKFKFDKRVAPNAEDPVNVLLNLGFTWLYRWASLTARQTGLSPAIGFLHENRSGHLTLASDLMEPFRHLVDRCVIAATHQLKPNDFQKDRDGVFRLRIQPEAAKKFTALVHQVFAISSVAPWQTEPRPYRYQLASLVRTLHRHLLNPDVPFQVFHNQRLF